VNFVDISVLAVLGLSALLAFSRGFVRELLSIMSWVGATIIAIVFFPAFLPMVEAQIADDLLAKVAAAVILFVVSLFVLGFVNHFISSRVQKSVLGSLDRTLGLAFGIVRGIVVVALAHMAMTLVFPDPEERPEIVTTARSEPYAADAAEYLIGLLPPDLLEKGGVILDEGLAAAEKGGAALGVIQDTPPEDGEEAPKQDGQDGKSGYNDAERKDLERLLQGSQSEGQ
jgi:membrane protein required for colicin V production